MLLTTRAGRRPAAAAAPAQCGSILRAARALQTPPPTVSSASSLGSAHAAARPAVTAPVTGRQSRQHAHQRPATTHLCTPGAWRGWPPASACAAPPQIHSRCLLSSPALRRRRCRHRRHLTATPVAAVVAILLPLVPAAIAAAAPPPRPRSQPSLHSPPQAPPLWSGGRWRCESTVQHATAGRSPPHRHCAAAFPPGTAAYAAAAGTTAIVIVADIAATVSRSLLLRRSTGIRCQPHPLPCRSRYRTVATVAAIAVLVTSDSSG